MILPNSDRDFQIFMDILQNAGKEWAESQENHPDFPRPAKPFHVIFHCLPVFEKMMVNKLNEVNAKFSKLTIA